MPLYLPPAAASAASGPSGSNRDRLRHMYTFTNGNGGTSLPVWTLGAEVGALGSSTVNFMGSRYFTVPLWTGPGGTLDGLSFYGSATAAQSARMAVWSNTANNNLMPSTRLAQSPTFTVGTTGARHWWGSIGYTAPADTLLWVSVIFTGTVSLWVPATATLWNITGMTGYETTAVGLNVDRGYGWWSAAGGSTFPTGDFPTTYPSEARYPINSASQYPAILARMTAAA